MTEHVASASMLVRRPVAEVFAAFVSPGTITKFWLDATSGPLAKGARVTWRFLVPGATEVVTVTAFEEDRRIGFDWSDGTSVDMSFAALADDGTLVAVEAKGFRREQAAAAAVNATEGFSIVLCDLKTLLETGRSANLVRDKAHLIASGRKGES